MKMIMPEIVSAGIYNSQIAAKNVKITKIRKTTMFEIDMPMSPGGISYVDMEEMQIEPGLIICAKPGQSRHTRTPFKCFYIHMILNEGAIYDTLMNIPDFVKTERLEKYRNIFIRLCKYYDSAFENDKIMVYSLALELIHSLSKDSQKQYYRNRIKTGNYEIIEKVIRYINQNLASDLSLNTVANYASLSPIYFHNFFKDYTEKTLHEFVEEQRIKKASNLLITTDWTLTRISEECGFSSQSYFSYAFKRKTGLTPREYAKEIFKRYETNA